jgi:hypothetical protein
MGPRDSCESNLHLSLILLTKSNGKLRPAMCEHCSATNITVCLAHLGFAPCVPCKRSGATCNTAGKGAIIYHNEMVDHRAIVYDDECDFSRSRRLKPEVRVKHIATARSRKGISGKVVPKGLAPAPNELMGAIQGLCDPLGRMELDMRYVMHAMHSIIAQSFQGVTAAGHQNNIVVPPREPTSFPAQPAADRTSENISMQPTYSSPSHYEMESTYPGAWATDSRMHQSSSDNLMAPFVETPYDPRHDAGTGPYQFPAAPMPGVTYMPHDGTLYDINRRNFPEYVQGSSTGQSTRETQELWQEHYPYGEEE